jgi:hypothetical protein
MVNTIGINPTSIMEKAVVKEITHRPYNYNTREDKKDTSEILNKLRKSTASTSDFELLELANKLLSIRSRNKKIDKHEAKIENIMFIIIEGTQIGDRFNRQLLLETLYKHGFYGESMNDMNKNRRPCGALSVALYRLEQGGYIVKAKSKIAKQAYSNYTYENKTTYVRIG